MLEKMSDIPLKDAKTNEDIDNVLKEHLGIGLEECVKSLSESLQSRAEELVPDMINLSPYGDFSKMTEDPEVILNFLKEESVKIENWNLEYIDIKKGKGEKDQLMELIFVNKSIDQGDLLKGFVFVGLSGKIRHSFCQVHT
jgi:hypothetical protein